MTAAHKVADKNLDDLRVRCGVWDIKVRTQTLRKKDIKKYIRRETERQRDRETERQRDREAERQRDRETERERKKLLINT